MDIFVPQNGKECDQKNYMEWLDDKHVLDLDNQREITKKYSLPLWLHLCITLHNVNQKVVLPLTMWTMLQEYRGLSRLGRQFCIFVGLSPSIRSYDARKV